METTAYPRPATLAALLALDASRRTVGIADGLVPLEACAPKSWDFSAPTLTVDDSDSFAEYSLCPDSATFAQEFYKAYPALQGVPLDGLLVAGGAVGQFLQRRGGEKRLWTAADVDLFVHGHASPAEAQARLRRLIADLDAAAHERERAALRGRLEKVEAEYRPASSRAARPRAAEAKPKGLSEAQERDAHRAAASCRRLLESFASLEFAPKKAGGNKWAPRRPAEVDAEDWVLVLSHVPNFYYALPSVSAVRTAGSVTIESGGLRLQVVLRHYAAPSEVLHGFDLGAAAAGFDGARVWLTELGRFSYEHRCLVVDTSRRSLTFEARLVKYHKRGFNLVLPGLDVGALPRRNLKYGYKEVADLPGFPFAYAAVDGNRVAFEAFPKTFGASSDYGPEGADEADAGFAWAYMNLYRLVNGRTDFIYAAAGDGYAAADAVLTKPPHLTLEMMHATYNAFRKTCWDGARLNARTLERYVPATPVKDITAAVFAAGRPMDAVLDEAFTAQRAEATRLWKLHIQEADHSALPWVTENPGGQQGPLTGSRSPIVENPGDWYGEYLRRDNEESA